MQKMIAIIQITQTGQGEYIHIVNHGPTEASARRRAYESQEEKRSFGYNVGSLDSVSKEFEGGIAIEVSARLEKRIDAHGFKWRSTLCIRNNVLDYDADKIAREVIEHKERLAEYAMEKARIDLLIDRGEIEVIYSKDLY